MKDKITIKIRAFYEEFKSGENSGNRSTRIAKIYERDHLPGFRRRLCVAHEAGMPYGEMLGILAAQEEKTLSKLVYNSDRADVAQLVEQLIRNQ